MDLALHIPDEAARFLAAADADLPRAALEALAVDGYRSKRLSDGQLRKMLGFSSRMQVHSFLKVRGVYLHYSLADLDQDRNSPRELEEKLGVGDSHAA